MVIEVRNPAKEQLKKLQFKENEGIRIMTEEEGGCSLFVDYNLKFDSKTETDELIISSEIPFIISEKSKGAIPDKIYLTYDQSGGYKLFTDEGILKANLNIKLS